MKVQAKQKINDNENGSDIEDVYNNFKLTVAENGS